jgi:hypothetical protein
MKNIAARTFICLLSFLLTKAGAQGVSDLLQQGLSVQHAVVPLYTPGAFKLSAVVRVDSAFMDFQRRGFFRIGMFPIGVLDGVTFEARDAADPMAGLASFQRWLATKAGQRIEMRRIKLVLSTTNRLEAGLARSAGGDRWELLNGVHFVSGDREIQAPRGLLNLAGPRGGQVVLETAPRATCPLFASALTFNDSPRPRITDPHPSK